MSRVGHVVDPAVAEVAQDIAVIEAGHGHLANITTAGKLLWPSQILEALTSTWCWHVIISNV